jgi:LysM repeat protein
MGAMTRFVLCSFSFLLTAMICTAALAQAPSGDKSEALLDALTKKIDLQNAKIDALSQQILKLEQHVSAIRPGVMIGETPAPVTAEAPKPPPQTGNSHVVAKGETLTSIAKMHKVSVEELQRFNHIENDRKLQIGQTIMIPTPTTASSPPNG